MKNENLNSKSTQVDTEVAQFNMETFSKRLREVMTRDGITQEQLGKKLGSKRQTISQYVNGTIQPNIGKLFEIAEIFKVSADWLIGLVPNPSVDMNIAKIGELTGLSEKAITMLMEEADTNDKFDWLKNDPHYISRFQIINILMEQDRIKGDAIDLLGEVLTHTDEGAPFYVLYATKFDDKQDIVVGDVAENPPDIDPKDVIYIRLLKLQQAVQDLKDEFDKKRKPKGDDE